MHSGKKKLLFLVLVIYCFSLFLQHFFAFFEVVAKEVTKPQVALVAILVDEQLVVPLKKDLQRYASEYIQSEITDSKALVLPVNLKTISSYDLYKMLENVYFDGLSGVNSRLEGVILIGDIPLPVVNQEGYLFPTIFPYVDFLDQKYLWDPSSQYFVPNGNLASQAEVWHGWINYDRPDQYQRFFEKIKKYVAKPEAFIGKELWYEDFIASKEAFLDQNLQFYQNKILFAEDLDYQRYHPLMLQLFQNGQETKVNSLLSKLDRDLTSLGGDALPSPDQSSSAESLQ